MRTSLFRRLVVVVGVGIVVPLVLAACGDDANDHGVAARQLASRLDAARIETSDIPTSDIPTTEPATTEPVEPAVEPTGVLVSVVALDNSFRPEVVEIDVGDEVVWENRGLNEHDVLYVEDRASPFGVEAAAFQPGAVYSHVFTEPGEFRYYCSIHGNETVGMVGTVIVMG